MSASRTTLSRRNGCWICTGKGKGEKMKQAMITLLLVLSPFFNQDQQLPRVFVLSTGGTIASKYDAGKGGLVPALTGAQLVEAVPELKNVERIEVEQIANVFSADITPEIWLKLSRRANELLADPTVIG